MSYTVDIIFSGFEGRKSIGLIIIDKNRLPLFNCLYGVDIECGMGSHFNLVISEENLDINYCYNCEPLSRENAELIKKVKELEIQLDRFKRKYKWFKHLWKTLKVALLRHENKIINAQYKEK